ncbi:hypothetical protein CRUP_022534 [Coryphaenoides rupestris]|nr:hypothetical protein CRUP_022534 [Coryphaenoides rupestris]
MKPGKAVLFPEARCSWVSSSLITPVWRPTSTCRLPFSCRRRSSSSWWRTSISSIFCSSNLYLYLLSSQRQYTLRVELTDWSGHQAYSFYDRFLVGSEKQNYR